MGGEILAAREKMGAEMVELISRLSDFYEEPEEIVLWLLSGQPLLGNRKPVDLMAEGKSADLYRVLQLLEDGAYI